MFLAILERFGLLFIHISGHSESTQDVYGLSEGCLTHTYEDEYLVDGGEQ